MTTGPTVDSRDLRKTLGCFLTGVTVVTTVDSQGVKRGFTANSFTSVSLDPPLVLVCLAKTASSYAAFAGVERFAVNILADDQRTVSSAFASKQADKFAGVGLRPDPRPAPILEGVLAWLDCQVHQRVDAGDHVVLMGRVLDHGHSERTPLGFYGGNYVNFGLERRAVEAVHDHPSTVGGIFEHDGKILLIKQGEYWWLPTGRTLGERDQEPGSLFELLRQHRIEASVSFVFSIAHEEGTGRINVYYRGDLGSGPPPDSPTAQMVPLEALPWDIMPPNPSHRLMLDRYMKERSEARFGIYVGTTRGGTIKSLEPGA